MLTARITREHLVLLLELCLDGAERCRERARAARERDDRNTAIHEVQQEEQCLNLIELIFDEIRERGGDTQDLRKELREMHESLAGH